MAAEVFISYAREDREIAQALATVLAADGHSVWWDRDLGGGDDFSLEIERQLGAARVAIVLWSKASAQSGFVRDESSRARDTGKLLPLRIADVPLPLGFGNLHTLDLLDWDGDADDEACAAVRAEVRAKLRSGPTPLPSVSPPTGHTGLRWRRWRWQVAALVAAGAAVAIWFASAGRGDREAQAQFNAGLAAHFAREPNLEVARNAYLAALRARPRMGPAHYYLAHVYVLLQLFADARMQFDLALTHGDDLDPAQRSDAEKQRSGLQALLAANEPPPVFTPTETALLAKIKDPEQLAIAELSRQLASAAATRVGPSDATLQAARRQGDALLGRDRQAQVTAGATLALDASLAADTLPLVLQRTLDILIKSPGSDEARQAVATALRLLQSSSPSLLRAHASAAERIADAGKDFGGTSTVAAADVSARLAKAMDLKPFVFLQIADERQRMLARRVAAHLAASGYRTPGIENVGAARAPNTTQLRLQGASDPALARWMAQDLAKLVHAEVPLQPLRQAKPATDTFEIWFERDLCVTPARTLPECL